MSLFIEPDPRQIEAALRLGAPVVELHTGRYAELDGEARAAELRRLADAAALAAKNGIEVHAGHGLTYDNVAPIAAIPQVRELNIGHFLVGEAMFVGLARASPDARGDGRGAVSSIAPSRHPAKAGIALPGDPSARDPGFRWGDRRRRS